MKKVSMAVLMVVSALSATSAMAEECGARADGKEKVLKTDTSTVGQVGTSSTSSTSAEIKGTDTSTASDKK